jgi:hypothetical protein
MERPIRTLPIAAKLPGTGKQQTPLYAIGVKSDALTLNTRLLMPDHRDQTQYDIRGLVTQG